MKNDYSIPRVIYPRPGLHAKSICSNCQGAKVTMGIDSLTDSYEVTAGRLALLSRLTTLARWALWRAGHSGGLDMPGTENRTPKWAYRITCWEVMLSRKWEPILARCAPKIVQIGVKSHIKRYFGFSLLRAIMPISTFEVKYYTVWILKLFSFLWHACSTQDETYLSLLRTSLFLRPSVVSCWWVGLRSDRSSYPRMMSRPSVWPPRKLFRKRRHGDRLKARRGSMALWDICPFSLLECISYYEWFLLRIRNLWLACLTHYSTNGWWL